MANAAAHTGEGQAVVVVPAGDDPAAEVAHHRDDRDDPEGRRAGEPHHRGHRDVDDRGHAALPDADAAPTARTASRRGRAARWGTRPALLPATPGRRKARRRPPRTRRGRPGPATPPSPRSPPGPALLAGWRRKNNQTHANRTPIRPGRPSRCVHTLPGCSMALTYASSDPGRVLAHPPGRAGDEQAQPDHRVDHGVPRQLAGSRPRPISATPNIGVQAATFPACCPR